MFGSPPIDSHRPCNRDLRGSPLATHYHSTQGQTIVTVHVSSAHARKYVISFLLIPEKSGSIKSVGLEPTTYIEYYGSAWRGRAPEIPVTKSVRVNWRSPKHIPEYFVGYIALLTGPRSHVTTWFSG